MISYVIAMSAVLVEPLSKHTTYVGFYMQRFVTVFYQVYTSNNFMKKTKLKSFILVVLLCGIIGIAHSRNHHKHHVSRSGKVQVEEKSDLKDDSV